MSVFSMNLDSVNIEIIILSLTALISFIACVVLFLRLNSLRNKMFSEKETIKAEELIKYEKKRNELEMILKEREIELKSEYEEMLSLGRLAKIKQDESIANANAQSKEAQRAAEKAETEYLQSIKMRDDYKRKSEEYVVKLANLSKLRIEDIREKAKVEIEKKCVEDLAMYRSEILENAKRDIDNKAQRVLADSIERIVSHIPESAFTSIVKIPEESMKARLIGREGRNIRSFESATSTTLIVDETPECVTISSFNPIRRQIAKIALEGLIEDGKINPTTIEFYTETAKNRITEKVLDIGIATADSLNILNVNTEVLNHLGGLNFHLSLNQNTLEHSVEVAKICALIAAELNCDINIAKRIGLFHDIGKTITGTELSHAKAAASLLQRTGEDEIVVNAVEAHHNEVPQKSIYATILCIADTLSSSRPGARMEATESYIQRIKTLEAIAMEFEGVNNAYVLQAGRELRVIVSPDTLNDVQAYETARNIRNKIEQSTLNSLSVKITLIREQRFIESTIVGR